MKSSASATPRYKEDISNPVSVKEAILIIGMLMLLCFIVFHKFILGYSVYLFRDIGGDTLNVYYPSYINVSDLLHQGELPGWSFEQGLGQNVFPFSLSDPTTYLLFIFGSEKLPFGIVWMEIFKITCSGWIFFLFLKKLSLSANAAYIGSLIYAFSGYMILGGSWYPTSTLGLYTALLLLSFEMLYLEKKWWLFPISVSLIAAYNFVSLYTCSEFLLLYVLFRVLADDEINYKELPSLFRNLLLLGLLGVLISAVFSIPNLIAMIDSPRVSGDAKLTNEMASIPIFEPGDSGYLATLLMRTFSSDLLGNGSSYKGWNNYFDAPMSYCGLISLVLVPQLFAFLKIRQKFVYGAFIGIFIWAEIFPWFRRGFWLFQGDYFRDFSLYVSIIFILFSVLALDRLIKGREINLPILGATLVALLILLNLPLSMVLPNGNGSSFTLQEDMDHGIQTKIAIFLVLIAASLIPFSIKKYRKYAQVGLLALTFIELASLSYETVNQRDALNATDLHNRIGYNDYSLEAISFIKQQDRDFFRIEKNYGSSLTEMQTSRNDSKVQHYFGSSSYSSFNNFNYINFLNASGALNSRIELETRTSDGVKAEPLLQILTGVKYFLFKGDWRSETILTEIYTEIGNFDDVTVLKSKYALPMGVAYDAYIAQSDFSKLDTDHKQIALLRAIMVPDKLASELSGMVKISADDLLKTSFSVGSNDLEIELANDTSKLKADRFYISEFSNNRIDGEIDTKIRQLVFFSFPFDRGWKVKVNGRESALLLVDGGLSAVQVEPGKNIISLQYSPPFARQGMYLTLLGFLIFGILMFRSRSRSQQLKLQQLNVSQ